MIGKLLVVDDEVWFREGLVAFIGGNALGWDVVGEASDGEEAMEAVHRLLPDLVITDINMPVMDGLDLTAWLSRVYPEIMVIILTGYRDFEYARRALRYGAVEFMLKPFALDEASRVLRKTHEEFRLKELAKRVREQERQAELFRAAISGLPSERETKDDWETRWAGFSFGILHIRSYYPAGKGYQANDVNLLHYAVTNIVQELLQVHQPHALVLPLNKDVFAFLLEAGSQEDRYRIEVETALRSYIGLQGEWIPMGVVHRFDELHVRFERLQEQQLGPSPEVETAGGERRLKEELLALLVVNDLTAAERLLTNYIDQTSRLELQRCKTNVYTLVTVFSAILLSDFKQLKAAVANDELNPRHILDFESVPALLDWAREKCAEFLGMFQRWLDERQNNVVYRAEQYIQEHYREACSLQSAAAHVHVSPNYLSNLFKKETGVSFTHYVSQLRVEKAKALLQSTKMRMTEIAEEAGFDNSSYFTVVFKQATGQSPREFRKQFDHTGE
ncbi:hypothetical protein B1748_15655 [Paenibacillus sp. MY03]|uniref:response regulator n=1 Tax=Paenibacillus sp. MY03 TaxID=302980 RepID=UPI000B3CD739|nr:helix-turn-helix domain-containing protein [Paenibacillus sp. MY03]OUS75861.1 hypothetical protein B1748_15655 [Paenibacillus sp. MY03]